MDVVKLSNMVTQKTFKNATLRTVNNGFIELDCENKIHCFHNASVVSIKDGVITIQIEWIPKNGELVKFRCGWCNTKYAIFKEIVGDRFWMYCSSIDTLTELPWDLNCPKYVSIIDGSFTLSPVTPEEQKEFDDFCKSQGKIWNKETLQWEKYKWKPKKGQKYYYTALGTEPCISWHIWRNDDVDNTHYQLHNCFKTEEEAKVLIEKIKKLLLEV